MAKSYILMGGRMLASGNEKRSWKSTRVVKLLGIDYPIIQAPFGGFPSQQLTAAVSNLGGLGSLGAVTLGSSAITEVIQEIRSLTTKPLAINLWVSTSDRQAARIKSDIIQSKSQGLALYYAELVIEPPLQVESKPQDFEIQVRTAVDALQCSVSFMESRPRKYWMNAANTLLGQSVRQPRQKRPSLWKQRDSTP